VFLVLQVFARESTDNLHNDVIKPPNRLALAQPASTRLYSNLLRFPFHIFGVQKQIYRHCLRSNFGMLATKYEFIPDSDHRPFDHLLFQELNSVQSDWKLRIYFLVDTDLSYVLHISYSTLAKAQKLCNLFSDA